MESEFVGHLHSSVHESWSEFLSEEIIELLVLIEKQISDSGLEFTPNGDRVLHFLTLDLLSMKVVILGQDPYPQKGVATGRAFEVGTLNDWKDTFRNTSLKNIVRAIYKADKSEIKTFNEIKKELKPDLFSLGFNLMSPNKLFKNWEQQGVLLLNTSFSCAIGQPGSHADYWQSFTKQLLHYINEKRDDLMWLLWGKHAQGIIAGIDIVNKIEHTHPMICSDRDGDFLFSEITPFAASAELIDWKGRE